MIPPHERCNVVSRCGRRATHAVWPPGQPTEYLGACRLHLGATVDRVLPLADDDWVCVLRIPETEET